MYCLAYLVCYAHSMLILQIDVCELFEMSINFSEKAASATLYNNVIRKVVTKTYPFLD